jgi:glycosyltransferase involved in cell wall biosynthesis
MPRFTNVPVLPVIPHLFGVTIFRETNPILATYVYFWERFIPVVYRHRRFAVISPSTKEDLIRRGIPEADVDVVLCGLDHGTFRLLPDVEKYDSPTIVHFGRVRKYKAIDVVIKAFARIRAQVGNARLIIIGDGPELGRLKQLSTDLGLDESVEFTGRVSAERLVDILNRCHLFMNASPKEGWGLTVVEANACGVPVIGSDRPGLQDSIHHDQTGYLVPYGDVEAFARRGVELLTDQARWSDMRAAGLKWANSLTWERCADEMEQLFLREAH